MTGFKGFETKEQAKAWVKEHGGYLCWEERTPKRNQLTVRGQDYMFAVTMGGLNREKYPYCVQWTLPKGKFEI